MEKKTTHLVFGTLIQDSKSKQLQFNGEIPLPHNRTCPITIEIDESIGEQASFDAAVEMHKNFWQNESELLRKYIAKDITAEHRVGIETVEATDEWLLKNYSTVLKLVYRVASGEMLATFKDDSNLVGWDLEIPVLSISTQMEHPVFGTLAQYKKYGDLQFQGEATLSNGNSCPLTIKMDATKGAQASLDVAGQVHKRFVEQQPTLLTELIAEEIPAEHRKTIQLYFDEDKKGVQLSDDWLLSNYANIYQLVYSVDSETMLAVFEDDSGFVGWDLEKNIEFNALL